jgi:uncharacterized protein YbbK (DUF523 family)
LASRDKNPPPPASIPPTPTPTVDTSEPVVVSACLAGRRCRYDGSATATRQVRGQAASGRAVLVCPEVSGGLPTPRPPAEIVGGDGADVLEGRARVVTQAGQDVTDHYLAGAHEALRTAQEAGARVAVLKARSPSCGTGLIRDGSFDGRLVAGDGVTAALFRAQGIRVVTEEDL